MAKKTVIGSIGAQSKSKQKIPGQVSLGENKSFKFSLAKSYASNVGNEENFNPSTIRSVAEPYDVQTKITSDSPEVVLFSNFEPAYNDAGFLNKLGENLQAKQESSLISASTSLQELKNSSVYSFIKDKSKSNREEINKFCSSFSEDASGLLSQIESVKKNFDCRFPKLLPYDENGNVDLVALQQEYDNALYDQPYSVEDILHDQISIKKWSSTKTWIQLCLELKEVLKRGAPTPLLTNVAVVSPDKTKSYLDSYSMTPAASSFISKFGFSDEQVTVPSLFEFTNITNIGFDNFFEKIVQLFSKNTFNKKQLEDSENVSDSIGRLAFLLCREFCYSTKFTQELLDQYSYSSDGRDNSLNIWDHLIGTPGKDITDISSNPLGAGNSLISLSQSVEGNSEVLTFEDRYITDDVGLIRPAATLTPGTIYYLENSLNSTSTGFDTSKLDILLKKMNSSISMLDQVSKRVIFKSSPGPISFYSQKIGDRINDRAKYVATNSVDESDDFVKLENKINITKNILNNPISLIRTIESEILNGTPLLDRSAVTHVSKNGIGLSYNNKLWSRNSSDFDGGGTPSSVKPTDVSWLLISLAAEDSELKTLLFMHQIAYIQGTINNKTGKKVVQVSINSNAGIGETGNTISTPTQVSDYDLTYKDELVEKIINRVNQIVGASVVMITNEDFVEKTAIKNALLGVNEQSLVVLNKIGHLMDRIGENNWFKDSIFSSGQYSDNKVTPYSGIQKTTFYSAFFDLCCLIVHASNPERIVARHGNKYIIKKINRNIRTGIKVGNEYITVYKIDEILLNSEDLIWNQITSCIKTVNTVRALVKNLKKEIESFKTSLGSQKYSQFLNTANSILGDPNLTKMIMTKEQLNLIVSNLTDYSERSSPHYSTPVKNIIPYFSSLKGDNDLDLFVPIEDIYLNSWNMWIKEFLKEGQFRESEGFNKKILSVGIPQKLHRRLQLNAANLKSSSLRSSLIKLKVYRIDNLRPDLIHTPQEFLFDTLSYARRILLPYFEQVNLVSNSNINNSFSTKLKDIPTIKAPKDSGGKFSKSKIKDFSKFSKNDHRNGINYPEPISDDSTVEEELDQISNSDKELMSRCHKNSFMMELYLKFLSDVQINENKFIRYSSLENFYSDNSVMLGGQSFSKTKRSFQKYFSNATFADDVELIKKDLILPRKFDRLFHLIIDPDDFSVDAELTPKRIIDKYLSLKQLKEDEQVGSADKIYKRIRTQKGEITFDKYFVTIETFGEKSVST